MPTNSAFASCYLSIAVYCPRNSRNSPKGEILEVEDLPAEIRGKVTEAKPQPRDLKGIARESSEIIEKRAILDALSKTGGNITQAAKALGVSRATLQNKMKLYGLRAAKPTA